MRLESLSSPDVAEHAAAGGILVVPVGSTEQHGPHLALGTDTQIAVALADELARRLAQVAVAPAIAYGSSGEHAGFAGTISIGQAALELLLIELGRSASQTYQRLVIVSAHGGNASPAQAAVAQLHRESRSVLLWMPRWSGDAHAGRTETSLQLALDPSRVQTDRAVAGNCTPIRQLLPALQAHGVRAISPNGVLGDPAGASADEGRELLQHLADDLESAVGEWLMQ